MFKTAFLRQMSIISKPEDSTTKTLVLGNLFKFERLLPSHSHGLFASGDKEKNKTIVIFSSSLSPNGKLPARM